MQNNGLFTQSKWPVERLQNHELENSGIHQFYLYQKCGFRITGVDRNFFLTHYTEKIYENGIQCRDMIPIEKETSKKRLQTPLRKRKESGVKEQQLLLFSIKIKIVKKAAFVPPIFTFSFVFASQFTKIIH